MSQYLGCYEEDLARPLFSASPGGYDPAAGVTPEACALACSQVGFAYAAVQEGGDFCTCSKTNPAILKKSTGCNGTCSTGAECGGAVDPHPLSAYLSASDVVVFAALNVSVDRDRAVGDAVTVAAATDLDATETVEKFVAYGDGSPMVRLPPVAPLILIPGVYTLAVVAIGREPVAVARVSLTPHVSRFPTVSIHVTGVGGSPINSRDFSFVAFGRMPRIKKSDSR
ncbi:unnamed protein product [Darwinula stevensoni]|uniref:WSC domain-containing protein n=1 Tax=Darwinula stevensoni TaxID=69355 RepID=A0A7R8X5N1_9CRUS|nr:unnamed protein product [Darwinula stevensoni]CAG0884864.1 unnamed protein product [Darwinula stevensoni]